MAVVVMSAVFERSRSKGAARLVLLALADVAADTGEVTAYRRSRSALAAKANVDAKTVTAAIATLVELGELEVLAVGGGRRSSDYRITLPPPVPRGGEIPPLVVADEGGRDSPPAGAPAPPQRGRGTPPIIPSSTSPSGQAPPAEKPAGPRRYSDAAHLLAAAEWERRDVKPVCGFVALRERISEALAAGHSEAAVARVLPGMPVFSRNAFDLALAGSRNPGRSGGRPIDNDRAGPSGRVEVPRAQRS